jgi:hypothetical protein
MKPRFIMNSYTLTWIIWEFPVGIFQISNHDNEVFAIISFTYTISDFQTPETLRFLTVDRNGAMWKTCFSARQNAKNEHQLKHKIRYVTDFFLSVKNSNMKDYTCHYGVTTKKSKCFVNFNINENFEIFVYN